MFLEMRPTKNFQQLKVITRVDKFPWNQNNIGPINLEINKFINYIDNKTKYTKALSKLKSGTLLKNMETNAAKSGGFNIQIFELELDTGQLTLRWQRKWT